MTALPATILPRVGSLVRLCGSPVDGEALGAVRALGRTLKSAGADFNDLADVLEREPAPRQQQRWTRPPPHWDRLDRSGRMNWLDIARKSEALTPWERDFAASLYGQVQAFRQASPKQAAIAAQILEKLYATEAHA